MKHLELQPDGSGPLRLSPRQLYESYAAAVAYLAVRKPDGTDSIGSAFHIGEGVFLTARHVVDGNAIVEVATTVNRFEPEPSQHPRDDGSLTVLRWFEPGPGRIVSGPLFHPDPSVDVAALKVEGIECPAIPLGSHLDDWFSGPEFVLNDVLVLGYPPIPTSKDPVLNAARGEVNAVVDRYTGKHPHFVVSTTARGGYSGGPCLSEWDYALGLVTESLVVEGQPTELGYLAVLSVEPLFVCLQHHGIAPKALREVWGDFWDRESG